MSKWILTTIVLTVIFMAASVIIGLITKTDVGIILLIDITMFIICAFTLTALTICENKNIEN